MGRGRGATSRRRAAGGRWAALVVAVVAATALAATSLPTAPGRPAGRQPQRSAGLVGTSPGLFPAALADASDPAPGGVTWTWGTAPVTAVTTTAPDDGAYTSTLTLTFDSPLGR